MTHGMEGIAAQVVDPTINPGAVDPSARGGNVRRIVGAGLLAASLLVTAACDIGGNGLDEARAHTATEAQAGPSTTEAQPDTEVCPDGIFPNGLFEASQPSVLREPDNLARSPEKPLTNLDSLLDYMTGPDGIACESAAVAGTDHWLMRSMYGEGAVGAISDNSVEDHINTIAISPDAAKSAVQDIYEALRNRAEINEHQISGAYYKIVRAEGPDGMVYSGLKKVDDINIEAGSAFILRGGTVTDDSGRVVGDPEQVVVIDKVTGNVYVLKTFGPAEQAPETTTTSTPPTTMPQGGTSGRKSGPHTGPRRKSGTGSSGRKSGQGQGVANTGGAAGPNGTNPEAGPGGTTESPANGGTTGTIPGNGSGNGGRGGEKGNGGGETPPTTTAPHKGSEVTIPGAPS